MTDIYQETEASEICWNSPLFCITASLLIFGPMLFFLFYLQTMFMVIPFVVNGVLTKLYYSHPAVLILQTIYTSS